MTQQTKPVPVEDLQQWLDAMEGVDNTVMDLEIYANAGSGWVTLQDYVDQAITKIREALAQPEQEAAPIDMVLFCPACGMQHIDEPKQCDMGMGCKEASTCYALAHGPVARR